MNKHTRPDIWEYSNAYMPRDLTSPPSIIPRLVDCAAYLALIAGAIYVILYVLPYVSVKVVMP